MSDEFFKSPIRNSPYEYPREYWELDESGQPTGKILEGRRPAEFITPIPKPRKSKADEGQKSLPLDEGKGLSTDDQAYDPKPIINALRDRVDRWRMIPNPSDWRVTPETARLLQHWRHHHFSSIRPFFCQVEALEIIIWLTEVAPKLGKDGRAFLDHLEDANEQANSGLARLALKMATGAGKTTVMAMLIAWQTINSVRRPTSKNYTRGFLIVTPGITIKDRLRVLKPNDPDSYYKSRELVPDEMLGDLDKAKIVITNYHAFKLRETMQLSKGGRSLLQGRGEEIHTLETEGQMIQRVMPELMGMKSILAINDEAHHCYREKLGEDLEGSLKGEDRKEAEKNSKAARLWMSGLEAVDRKLGLRRVVDLSATPFFLRGSGYGEGTLFHWTMSDFSLMDAIECGIVKLPRVPVADNIPGGETPKFRNLWDHIGKRMPKKGRGKNAWLDPRSIPAELETALLALYAHYEKTFEFWQEEDMAAPPCFIVVCQNTSISKLIYDFIAGFEFPEAGNGTRPAPFRGRLPLFSNFSDDGTPRARPRTLLIDSEQLESGEALEASFRKMAAKEIERFRREIIARTGDKKKAENLSDQELLREVMNTVGKPGRLGGEIRCVVSVSMLTEGWDANTVTHILGIRAFGTQLLCEQVIGRALRRHSYDLNEESRFNVEYADVLGIPFDFTAKPVVAPPQPPQDTVQVRAIRPDRDALEIRYPRVVGYRVELPAERLDAKFTEDSTFVLTPERVGPTRTRNEGIIGEGIDLTLIETGKLRQSTLLFNLTKRLIETHGLDENGEPRLHLFGQYKRIAKHWLDHHLVCQGGTSPAQLMYLELAEIACRRIAAGIDRRFEGESPTLAIMDPYNPIGSTSHVSFTTSKKTRWKTDADKCHVNWAICDSNWEAEFCRVAEAHPRVRAYVKNQGLGFEVPYRMGSTARRYVPDFILHIDDNRGDDDPLNLIVEIKGYRGEDAKEKRSTMETYWIPGINHAGEYGRWAFAEFADIYEMEDEFGKLIDGFIAEKV